MCNLYSTPRTKKPAPVPRDEPLCRQPRADAGRFPDYPAPVIRNSGGELEMTMMRWGMPPPTRTGGPPGPNIRNTSSPHWRMWLKPENPCLVLANSFAEYAPEPSPETKKKHVVWFALSDDRPLFAFAGIRTTFNGDRGTKSKPVPGPHQVYGFLTTSPNAVVEPIHPKANAGDPAHRRRARRADGRTVGGSEGVASCCRTMRLRSSRAEPTRKTRLRLKAIRLPLNQGPGLPLGICAGPKLPPFAFYLGIAETKIDKIALK